MSLMKSKQPKTYRWQAGDLISPLEACRLLGYKSAKRLHDERERAKLVREFKALGCTLTDDIWVGGTRRFLRQEFDEFLTLTVEAAQKSAPKKRNDLLRMAA